MLLTNNNIVQKINELQPEDMYAITFDITYLNLFFSHFPYVKQLILNVSLFTNVIIVAGKSVQVTIKVQQVCANNT